MALDIILVVHNLRSSHNVGSLFRTADCLGVSKLFLCGYTPHPKQQNDTRLPHIINNNHRQISKTALGAENHINWEYQNSILAVINNLKNTGHEIIALEQAKSAEDLNNFIPQQKTAIIVGNEVDGIDKQTLKLCDKIVEIPMRGSKESLNVVQATAIALYSLQNA